MTFTGHLATIGAPLSLPDHWSPRSDTVHRLYSILLSERLVQVRGTPGCGKTTLMRLLRHHILQTSPEAFVNVQTTWLMGRGRTETDAELRKRLKKLDPEFPRKRGLAFLLFDEAQDTYEDALLGSHSSRAYGRPSSRPVSFHYAKSLTLRNEARISLRPQEGSIGILLTRLEFDEVVEMFPHSLNLHPDLKDLIFKWTGGHAGAVVELLRVISHRVSLVAKTASVREWGLLSNSPPQNASKEPCVQCTVETFHEDNPMHQLVEDLRGGAFEPGLPQSEEPAALNLT